MPHVIQYRVYYEDTDAAGIVYYANYLKFAERARTDWLRTLGFEQSRLREESGMGIVVRRCEADFLSPARLDDLIAVETRLHETGKVRMTMRQEIKCMEKLLARLTVELACVNRQGTPVRWPAALLQAFQA